MDEPGTSSPGAAPPRGADTPSSSATAAWPAKAVDAVDLVVDTVHDKVIRPLVLVGRAVVFGLLIAALGTLLVVVVSIALIRLLDVYAFGHRVWASYALVGFVFTVAGLGAWSLRTRRSGAADAR
ncbi:MAG: hypothetical protein ACYCU7_06715 [Acidimicrobiales bacterium]